MVRYAIVSKKKMLLSVNFLTTDKYPHNKPFIAFLSCSKSFLDFFFLSNFFLSFLFLFPPLVACPYLKDYNNKAEGKIFTYKRRSCILFKNN